jgi:hypothetical protein
MIKINLLPAKRAKLRMSAASEPGSRDFAIGCAALAAVAAVVFFAVDQPKRSHLHDLRDSNDKLQQAIAQKNQQLNPPGQSGYADLKKAVEEADKRAVAINRLINAKVIPANVLHELGEILTANHRPTMTDDMVRWTGTGIGGDSNKRFDPTWDPTHVWLISFVDNNGDFTLDGGAEAEIDVHQLSKRLAASIYFANVAESRGERVADRESGISYYKFTITGKVAY